MRKKFVRNVLKRLPNISVNLKIKFHLITESYRLLFCKVLFRGTLYFKTKMVDNYSDCFCLRNIFFGIIKTIS